jgi:hypothetical protein
MTIKSIERFVYYCKEEAFVHLSIGDVLKDSNLNTLVEVSEVQFTEAAGRHYFEEANNRRSYKLEFNR